MRATSTCQIKGNDRLQVFDPQGRFLRKWGIRGSGDGGIQLASESEHRQ